MRIRSLVILACLPVAAACVAAGRDTAGNADATMPGAMSLVPGAMSLEPVGLRAPAGFAAAVASAKPKSRACPEDAEPYVGALDFPSKYEGSDSARDDLNKDAEKRYRALVAPVTAFEKGLSLHVDEYLRSGRPESLACATGLLREWSGANALMGEAVNHTGKSVRKWAMGSVASSYLRLKFSSSRPLAADPALMDGVEAWLAPMATRVVQEWDGQPLNKVNNHAYWAAWAVMATAVALDRRDLFEWSMQQFELASTQVDAQGFLPNELRRDTRALSYHNYALAPLAMIAAFAKANGAEVDSDKLAAVTRLADRVLDGIADPASFEQKTGKRQLVQEFSQHGKFSWMEPYCWTFTCDEAMQERLASVRPLKNFRLGGDLTEIFQPSSAKTGEADADDDGHSQIELSGYDFPLEP